MMIGKPVVLIEVADRRVFGVAAAARYRGTAIGAIRDWPNGSGGFGRDVPNQCCWPLNGRPLWPPDDGGRDCSEGMSWSWGRGLD